MGWDPLFPTPHWLLIPQCIEYKLVLITFKALHGMAPSYLEELLKWHQVPRTLRSNCLALLLVLRTRLKYYGVLISVK